MYRLIPIFTWTLLLDTVYGRSLVISHCDPARRSDAAFSSCPNKTCSQHIDCWVSFGPPQICVCDPHLCGPVCLPENSRCLPPEPPLNGTVNFSGLHIGEVAEYKCSAGFTVRGPRTRYCLANLKWSGLQPTICTTEKNACFSPPYIPHTLIQSPAGSDGGQRDDYRSGEQITVMCTVGYRDARRNFVQATCVGSEWSMEPLNCERITCPKLNDPKHGHVVYKSDRSYQAEAYSVCSEGFITDCGASYDEKGCQRICQADGTWSGSDTKCSPVVCPKLLVPEHGSLSSTSFEVNSLVTFKCLEGYELIGSAKRQCLPSGNWDGVPTSCNLRDCQKPPQISNGRLIYEKTTYGSEVIIECNDDTTPSTNNTRLRCGIADNVTTWLPQPIPTCNRHCFLFTVKNGDVVLMHRPKTSDQVLIPITTDKYFGEYGKSLYKKADLSIARKIILPEGKVRHGSQLNVTCHFGYQLAKYQPPITTCADGVWTVRSKCIPASCKTRPPIVRAGRARFYSRNHLAKARYECYPGYRLQLDETRPLLHAPLNNGKQDPLGTIRCLNGQWTGLPVQCAPIYCQQLIVNQPVRVEFRLPSSQTPLTHSQSRHGTVARFSCPEGLHVTGTSVAMCQNGSWTPSVDTQCSPIPPSHVVLDEWFFRLP